MKHENSSPLGLYTIGIAALFLAGFFLLVVFGAQSYRNTVAGQNDNMRDRALLSYLATTVKAYDGRDTVTVWQDENGAVISIADGDTGYALRIYLDGGFLVEDYAALGAALDPENAHMIGECERFAVESLDDGLLRIETDAGRVLLRLRSEGGGTA